MSINVQEVEPQCPICGSSLGFRDYVEWKTHRWIACRACGGGHKEPYIPETENSTIVEDRYEYSSLDIKNTVSTCFASLRLMRAI